MSRSMEWPIEARWGDDAYILRIEGADTPTVYEEFVPSWDEGWGRARELAQQIRRGEASYPTRPS